MPFPPEGCDAATQSEETHRKREREKRKAEIHVVGDNAKTRRKGREREWERGFEGRKPNK